MPSNYDVAGPQQSFDVGAEFERSAGQPANQSTGNSLHATAHKEIALDAEKERALDKHDQVWMRERDRLANKSLPTLTMDLGSQPWRSVQSEYEERRSEWDRGQDGIINEHAQRRAEIRAAGQTLSREFSQSHEPVDRGPASPSVKEDIPDNLSTQQNDADRDLSFEAALQQGQAPDISLQPPSRGRSR